MIRSETPQDIDAVRRVNRSAFETPTEADLVDVLCNAAQPIVSLVAEHDGNIVGHILFTPVTVTSAPEYRVMGLAPMAVAPEHQRQGVGSALVRAGLDRCRDLGVGAVVVLGHPDYYPRFGFRPAVEFGLTSEYEVPPEYFLALELEPGYLRQARGTIAYHAAFRDAGQ